MHLLIRADGDPDIGFGHLYRSNSVAEEFLSRGHQVTYATTTPERVTAVCSGAIRVSELASRIHVDHALEKLLPAVDAALVDTYTADHSYQETLREEVPVILVSDDTRHTICVDAVVNGNLYATDLEYNFTGPEPRWYLGTEYLLLRQSIRNQATKEPPWRDLPERALITMGGSDLRERTPEVIRAFDGYDLHVDAIVGPGFSEHQEREINRAAESVSAAVTPVRDPNDLHRRMFQSDFAVSTASTTTYELLALGTPIVSQPVVDNQQLIANALHQRDIATVLEQDSDEAAIQRAIEGYLSDSSLRKKRRERGRKLVDGRGAERVADAIERLIDE